MLPLLLLAAISPGYAQEADFSARLAAAIQAHAAAQVGGTPEDVEVVSTGFLGEGCGDRILLSSRPGESFLGTVELRVEARAGEALCGQWRVHARVARWAEIPVAKKAVAAGQPIELSVARVRLELPPGTPVSPDAGPYLARTPLRAGQPVVTENSRALPDVAAGTAVKVLVRAGSLTIASEGTLTQAARVGETVTVRSAATLTLLEGTLIAHDRVIVE